MSNKKKTKILLMASDNSAESGAFLCLVSFCEKLLKHDRYYPIVIIRKGGSGTELLKKKGIEYKKVRSFCWTTESIDEIGTIKCYMKMCIKDIVNFFACVRLVVFARKNEIQIIHINTILFPLGAFVAQIIGIPFLWHIRECLEEGLNVSMYKDDNYKMINKAEKIITVSNYVSEYYRNKLDFKRVEVIYDGVDNEVFFPGIRKRFSAEIIEFLCVGKFNNNKGQEGIIEAAYSLITAEIKNFHVTFVGGGKKENYYKNIVKKLKIEKYISFAGVQSNISLFYQNSDVYIMNSKSEAFGRVTVEAMMSGCLVIGADTGATVELLDHGKAGVLFEYGNNVDLVNKMKAVIIDRDMAIEISNRSRKNAVEKFTVDKNYSDIVSIYDSIVYEDK